MPHSEYLGNLAAPCRILLSSTGYGLTMSSPMAQRRHTKYTIDPAMVTMSNSLITHMPPVCNKHLHYCSTLSACLIISLSSVLMPVILLWRPCHYTNVSNFALICFSELVDQKSSARSQSQSVMSLLCKIKCRDIHNPQTLGEQHCQDPTQAWPLLNHQ